MKQALALLLLAFLHTLPLAAQSNQPVPQPGQSVANDPQAVRATDALAAKYSLSPDQVRMMYQIQVRKLRNESKLEALKTTDPALYARKRENLQTGTLGSIRRILNTPEQLQVYQKTQADLRILRAAKRKELLLQKAPPAVVEAAMLDLYAE